MDFTHTYLKLVKHLGALTGEEVFLIVVSLLVVTLAAMMVSAVTSGFSLVMVWRHRKRLSAAISATAIDVVKSDLRRVHDRLDTVTEMVRNLPTPPPAIDARPDIARLNDRLTGMAAALVELMKRPAHPDLQHDLHTIHAAIKRVEARPSAETLAQEMEQRVRRYDDDRNLFTLVLEQLDQVAQERRRATTELQQARSRFEEAVKGRKQETIMLHVYRGIMARLVANHLFGGPLVGVTFGNGRKHLIFMDDQGRQHLFEIHHGPKGELQLIHMPETET